ncbi:MAG TPA: bifunctional phosphoribosyl-AMP cyclohydrolase/phosphoribosyl-ATP diphosphatase HisIE [Sphingomicrobium sp.]|nr:bifunctional phosphoribosyl-AMP cyclohydrolase/phosphoribosyl-ATP diphosphatase HisIE [Sphingomicrobium sp.]
MIDAVKLDWEKMGGLIPAVVQDWETGELLMLGYMSRPALDKTMSTGQVTFFSRSRQELWTKGETSGHSLHLRKISADCDRDALLILAEPDGPTCHLGNQSCFGDDSAPSIAWLGKLARIVRLRGRDLPEGSYTAELLRAGLPRIAKKVGEEGVEVALAAVSKDENHCAEEIADLLYHLTVLMEAKGMSWSDVASILAKRHA